MRQIVFVILALMMAPAVFAHERQLFEIGEKEYLFVIGSLNEPAIVDYQNGISLRIVEADPKNKTNARSLGAKPVIGLEETLKAELISGAVKKIIPLEAAYNDRGAYEAIFVPTKEGELSYRVFGAIDGVPFDVVFPCDAHGHHRAPSEDANEIRISEGIIRTFKTGAFGCPVEKEDFGFPYPAKHLSSFSGKSASLAAFVTALIALLVSVAAFRRK